MLDIKVEKTVCLINIHGSQRGLKEHFFSTNLSYLDGRSCKNCKKTNLGKHERVDCEFWPNDIESWCLECWSKS